MINEYHRPKTLEEALTLLTRPNTVALGGGTALNNPDYQSAQFPSGPIAVVDLQALGLNTIEPRGKTFAIGATVTLHTLMEHTEMSPALKEALRDEATHNLRQMATIAGSLVACDGRSAFAAVMLALDAELTVVSDQLSVTSNQLPVNSEQTPGAGSHSTLLTHRVLRLGEFLPLRRLPGKLISEIIIPANVTLAYAKVSRTPADWPIVCAALARWPSGRTRLALGGYGAAPLLAMDGPEASGVETAARSAYAAAGDEWGTAEYRCELAAVLAQRCLQTLETQP